MIEISKLFDTSTCEHNYYQMLVFSWNIHHVVDFDYKDFEDNWL